VTEPSPLDIANAENRRLIAERERAEYARVLAYAFSLFGHGFVPHGQHYLVEADEATRLRYSRTERPRVVATVYSCRRGAEERHFVIEDGKARRVGSVEEGMPVMHDTHPTKQIDAFGKEVAPARYELCWGWFEDKRPPRSAEQLAAARLKRVRKKEQHAEIEMEKRAAASLFPDWERERGR